ncbi:MAG TPA: ParA family protein [Rhabdochlamydiaceae bacterium]|nr:ParA family protein [Rhabdochlamydiaceae bacterium]
MNAITVSSFKGGTAKTSTSLHIAAALSKFHKKRVLLIDFDAQANLTTGLGYDPDAQDSLAPVLQGNKRVQEVILPTCIPNLDLIPADTWLERVEVTGILAGDRYSHERLKEIIRPLKYDQIIIDTPPSLCWLTESALIAAQHSLVCVTPEFYSIKGLQRLALFMENISQRHPLSVVGVALSFWNSRGKSNQTFLEVIEETFPGKILENKIRRDISVSEASVYGKPIFEVAPTSRASEDYIALTKELLNRL